MMLEGINTTLSRYSVNDSVVRLERTLAEKGVKLFCIVDHSAEAAAAGLVMRPTKLLIFGSAKAGTPLMVAAPSTALDLPLRILVAEEKDGQVLLSWIDPIWLQQRHQFPLEWISHLAMAESVARTLA